MNWVASHAWLIPLLPLVAAGLGALLPRTAKFPAQALAIGAMTGALGLSLLTFFGTLTAPESAVGGVARTVANFPWFELGTGVVRLGFVVDPLASVMLVMVSFVGLLIFIFSTGYMAHDENVTRFFCFLSLFTAAMLGLVIANSLLLLFGCWELMGLASYLLIGFWYHKPSAAAAAKKAFVVTRIGDVGLFLGLLWLYSGSGTLLFYDDGRGCLEATALTGLTAGTVAGPLTAAAGISLLLLVGAIGKSGQVPLHVWLPDAMEGPTPVSALIHAATMVAAGVFLVARVFPLMTGGVGAEAELGASIPLRVVTWVGAVTALFAALMAVAQNDIKRILAYSTVSQLGYMFVGLGTGGVAVGMFHLITHAFFKALLFLGSGSVIHGCHEEQDIRHMGGLRRLMPWTFVTYAVGMMALAGVPLFFSGFWSKDEILHSAWQWAPSRWPFFMTLAGALLTSFYMTRQVAEVFFGHYRGSSAGGAAEPATDPHPTPDAHHATTGHGSPGGVHESPAVMTLPLAILAICAVVLGFVGTPAWPWFSAYLTGEHAHVDFAHLGHALPMMLVSAGVVAVGIGTGWVVYGRRPRSAADELDPLALRIPRAFRAMQARFWVDEFYRATVVALHRSLAGLDALADRWLIGGLVMGLGFLFRGLAYGFRWVDELFVNTGFDAGCATARWAGRSLARVQSGEAQRYLAWLSLGMALLASLGLLLWRFE